MAYADLFPLTLMRNNNFPFPRKGKTHYMEVSKGLSEKFCFYPSKVRNDARVQESTFLFVMSKSRMLSSRSLLNDEQSNAELESRVPQ